LRRTLRSAARCPLRLACGNQNIESCQVLLVFRRAYVAPSGIGGEVLGAHWQEPTREQQQRDRRRSACSDAPPG
jgi:hypothetical protein